MKQILCYRWHHYLKFLLDFYCNKMLFVWLFFQVKQNDKQICFLLNPCLNNLVNLLTLKSFFFKLSVASFLKLLSFYGFFMGCLLEFLRSTFT